MASGVFASLTFDWLVLKQKRASRLQSRPMVTGCWRALVVKQPQLAHFAKVWDPSC